MEEILKKIVENSNPYTVFLYGSRATKSERPRSDYEIGVVYEDEKYTSRKKLGKLMNNPNFSVYPFRLSELINCDIDTPFQKKVFINALAKGGAKIIYGKNIFENFAVPELRKEDLVEDIYFNLGLALAAVRIFRVGEEDLAKDMFCKSCRYVTREFLYMKERYLSLSYNETYSMAEKYKNLLSEYYDLIKAAYKIRQGEAMELPVDLLYKNISYINKFILKRI